MKTNRKPSPSESHSDFQSKPIQETRSASTRVAKIILLTGAIFALFLVLLSGCVSGKQSSPTSPDSQPNSGASLPDKTVSNQNDTPSPLKESGTYLGNEACAGCHSNEFKVHKTSGHNLTLAALEDKSSSALAPPLGVIPERGHLISKENGKFILSSVSRPDIKGELNFVMGSGNTGLTYLGISPTKIAEAQYSYFPKIKKWYRTPGHREKPDTSLGQIYKGEFAQKCVFCHSTHMESDSLIPQKKFFGVGCESCHGPGSEHVVAMKTGNFKEGKMVSLEKVGADRVIEVCQKCHTDQTDSNSLSSRQVMSGMKQSKCFLKGENTLSLHHLSRSSCQCE